MCELLAEGGGAKQARQNFVWNVRDAVGRRRRRQSDAIGGHSVAQSTLLSRLGTYLEAVLGLGLTLCADLREERRAGEDEDCFERWEKTLFR